jgi:cytochrome c oxidase cbb3-type subunit 3
MSDFTSGFWPIYISVITLVSIIGTWIFLKSQTTRKLAPGEKAELMEHTWDGDLQDLNNPLPRWWLGLFNGTLVFAIVYLVLWPGLGNYAGVLGWTSKGEYEAEVKAAEAKFQPVYAGFMQQDIVTVAADPDARAIGKNLFLTYCSQCHGSDAAGARGFPNLTDGDWLYGGEPETIVATITDGRAGVMPAMGEALGPDGTKEVANYVLSLSGRQHDAHARWYRHACARRGQPDRLGMALWWLRRCDHRDHHQGTQRCDARHESNNGHHVQQGSQAASAGSLCVRPRWRHTTGRARSRDTGSRRCRRS